MDKRSAGILLFRFKEGRLQVMLVHPGGPFWAKKDDGVWSIPKGLIEERESSLGAAIRELKEETGFDVDGEFIELGSVQQHSKKTISVWAVEKDMDVMRIASNTFSLEWPKGSGKVQEYLEVDRAMWFDIEVVKRKILQGQIIFIDRLTELLKSNS
jgi:predicted NUDIX family NTP pyrophosphohydrolase